MILHSYWTLFILWVFWGNKWFNLQTNSSGNFIRRTSINPSQSPTAKENPPNCLEPTLCSAGAKPIILATEIYICSIMANEEDCCTYHEHSAITIHNIHYSMAWWIHTDLLPVLSCSSSLRMDFPSMSGGVSSPAMWRIVGARSMFSTRWGFLKKYMHVQFN